MSKSGTLAIARDLATQMAKSALMALPPVRRWRLRSVRTSHDPNDLDQFLQENAFLGLNLLLDHDGEIGGKSVCEIGPGDFLSSGLSMLAAGASKYTALDRFQGNYDGEIAKDVYKKIAANWTRYYPDIGWEPGIDAEKFPEDYAHLVRTIAEPIETARVSEKFDIVCSFQVGEHVSDINAFAEAHNELLGPDAIGLHRVDFGPHDVWHGYRDPTTFLRFSDRIWRLTGSNRGIPNRRRHHEFLSAFEKANLEVDVLLMEHFDEELVDHSKLDKQFRSMPKDSVLVKTAIYRLKKRPRAL